MIKHLIMNIDFVCLFVCLLVGRKEVPTLRNIMLVNLCAQYIKKQLSITKLVNVVKTNVVHKMTHAPHSQETTFTY